MVKHSIALRQPSATGLSLQPIGWHPLHSPIFRALASEREPDIAMYEQLYTRGRSTDLRLDVMGVVDR